MTKSNLDLSKVTELPPHFVEAVKEVTRSGNLMLDFGSGGNAHRDLIEALGARYIGIDIRSGAMVRGDAHRLPFTEAAFDGAISMTVLEHLYNPFIATAELFRVLKPGAYFLGSVAFLEPFHDHSYCHLSRLGTVAVLESAGFQIVRMWPGVSILETFFDDLFVGWPSFTRALWRAFGKALELVRVLGIRACRFAARRVGRRGPDETELAYVVAGSIGFICRKPE